MSRFDKIIQTADKLVEKYDTRNPSVIADELDVIILYRNFKEQKGVFTMVEEIPFIFINNNLEEELQNVILTHELGHFLLHLDELGTSPFLVENNIFNKNTNRQEFEANLFASQILLPDDEILEYVFEGHTQYEIALAMMSNINLVAMKIETLIAQGYDLNKLEYKRNFM